MSYPSDAAGQAAASKLYAGKENNCSGVVVATHQNNGKMGVSSQLRQSATADELMHNANSRPGSRMEAAGLEQ